MTVAWVAYGVLRLSALVGLLSQTRLPLQLQMYLHNPVLFFLIPILLSILGCRAAEPHVPWLRLVRNVQVGVIVLCVVGLVALYLWLAVTFSGAGLP